MIPCCPGHVFQPIFVYQKQPKIIKKWQKSILRINYNTGSDISGSDDTGMVVFKTSRYLFGTLPQKDCLLFFDNGHYRVVVSWPVGQLIMFVHACENRISFVHVKADQELFFFIGCIPISTCQLDMLCQLVVYNIVFH